MKLLRRVLFCLISLNEGNVFKYHITWNMMKICLESKYSSMWWSRPENRLLHLFPWMSLKAARDLFITLRAAAIILVLNTNTAITFMRSSLFYREASSSSMDTSCDTDKYLYSILVIRFLRPCYHRTRQILDSRLCL